MSARHIAWFVNKLPSLDVNFLAGSLDSRITFTRAAGAATYFDSTGTLQNAGTNVARFDTDPASHAPLGLLVEAARTNVWLQSADANNAAWIKSQSGAGLPTTTANQTTAPDGTLTAAKIILPTATGSQFSTMAQFFNLGAVVASFSMWLKGNVGGEVVYIGTTPDGVNYYRTACTLTTSWQRFTLTTSALTATNWFFTLGFDRRDTSQTTTTGCTIFAWGAQVEVGAFVTSYIPTTSASATRAADVPTSVDTGWLNSGAGVAVLTAQTVPGVSANASQVGDGSHANPVASLITATPSGRYRRMRYWQRSLTPSQLARALQ